MSVGPGDLRALSVPVCPACGRHFWYPRAICGLCGESTVEEAGLFEGLVYSTTEVHRSKPEWRSALPYSVALVSCLAGFRILTQHDGLRIGDAVVVGQRLVKPFGVVPFSEISEKSSE